MAQKKDVNGVQDCTHHQPDLTNLELDVSRSPRKNAKPQHGHGQPDHDPLTNLLPHKEPGNKRCEDDVKASQEAAGGGGGELES